MKVYKIVLCYIDFDECGDEIIDMIEGANLGKAMEVAKTVIETAIATQKALAYQFD